MDDFRNSLGLSLSETLLIAFPFRTYSLLVAERRQFSGRVLTVTAGSTQTDIGHHHSVTVIVSQRESLHVRRNDVGISFPAVLSVIVGQQQTNRRRAATQPPIIGGSYPHSSNNHGASHTNTLS